MNNFKLKQFQEDAIDFLFNITKSDNNEKNIIFESPTGSGKTIMLIEYIKKYLNHYNNRNNTVFVWLTPGKGDLEEQSLEKMNRVSNLKTGKIDDVLNQGFNTNTTYFINWELITNKKNISLKDGERKNLFERIAEAHNKNIKFITIIDEEHQNNTKKADDIISALNSKYHIRVSATPINTSLKQHYIVKETDVINSGLITRLMYINKDLDNIKNIDNVTHETEILLEKADSIRKEIQEEYNNINKDIRPLVLVQFPNLNDNLIELVENKLKDMGYTYENKLLASWFSAEKKDDKNSKKLGKINIGNKNQADDITNNNAEPVFLLFKQALSTGWDCPRAKILVKLRENMNETFEIQTLGRLRRMPEGYHYDNDILNCSYLYTFDEKYKLDVLNSNLGFEVKKLFLKDDAKKIKLKKETRSLNNEYIDEDKVRKHLYESFKKEYNLTSNKDENKKILENNKYIFENGIISSYSLGSVITINDLNTNELEKRKTFIQINPKKHAHDVLDLIEDFKKIIGIKSKTTSTILKILFLKDSEYLNNTKNKRFKLLSLTKNEYIAFIINNSALLKEVLKKFSTEEKQQSFLDKEKNTIVFTIPSEEYYIYDKNSKDAFTIYNKNVYKDYTKAISQSSRKSKSERLFEEYCENNENVELIYKNGDKGIQYLSILYSTNYKNSLFYPDYLVQLKDGSIYIIETKGGETNGKNQNVDELAKFKFVALKNYSSSYNVKFGFVRYINEKLYFNNIDYIDDMKDDKWVEISKIF